MNVEIAQRLAELRRERGFSQEGLAEQLGLSRQAVSKWERGAGFPDVSLLEPLADALALAREIGLPMLKTPYTMFESCARLYTAGLKPVELG